MYLSSPVCGENKLLCIGNARPFDTWMRRYGNGDNIELGLFSWARTRCESIVFRTLDRAGGVFSARSLVLTLYLNWSSTVCTYYGSLLRCCYLDLLKLYWYNYHHHSCKNTTTSAVFCVHCSTAYLMCIYWHEIIILVVNPPPRVFSYLRTWCAPIIIIT